ncbi:hypothetical protein BDY24DRAFT_439948 [Mrakia frigida]|uniref:uncharacterized protein n=1 Tax=Mrakia frigida TaxID=29902 RepID=UPI003FCC14F4
MHSSLRYFLAILFLYLFCLVFFVSTSTVWSEEDPLNVRSKTGKEVSQSKQVVLESLWPQRNLTHESNQENRWKDHNQKALRSLMLCLANKSCSTHQDKVVILQDGDYLQAFFGHIGGEKIWSESVLRTFDLLGITYFFSRDNGDLATYYNMVPTLIKAAIVRPGELEDCWENRGEGDCIKSESNPHGIRIQDLFTSGFFGDTHAHPFGSAFTLTPERSTGGETYLGYSIEKECSPVYVPPHPTRPHQVWVLAKRSSYFYGAHSPVSNTTFIEASEALGVQFVGAWEEEGGFPGVTNIGNGRLLSKEEFQKEIVNSRAIVGLGDPIISPTPWYGLCWSIPFLNPVGSHLDSNGNEIIDWSQHPFAAAEGEPHVYNFPPSNNTLFISQLRKALEPHDRFVPLAMTQAEMSKRVLAWLERDWAEVVRGKMKENEGFWKAIDKDFLL